MSRVPPSPQVTPVTSPTVDLLASLGRKLRPTVDLLTASTVVLPSGSPLSMVPFDVLAAWGVDAGGQVTRSKAIGIPAMRRARQIIAGVIGTLPLVATRDVGGELVPVEQGSTPTLLRQLDPRTTPQWTLTWTVDDLLFQGISWWRKTLVDSYRWPLGVERLAPGRVNVSAAGQATVDGRPVQDWELIRFDGADLGLLVEGREALLTCLLLEAAARRNATGLPPMDILQPAEGAPDLTSDEARALLDEWRELRAENGTGWLNRSVEHQVVGFDARASQLVEARQHQAVEIARLTNLDAQELNAPAATGMTYTNTEAKRRDLLDVGLAPYLNAITQRLSMPDVTPRGQAVRFDTVAFLRGTTADAIKAAVEATGGPVMTPEEGRQGLLALPGTPTQGELRKSAPAAVPAPAAPVEQEA
jgi:hypothetical protein